ncbi:MAG TPA: AtpZ/AtpI family protein [Asticcacaulis sp.]
MTEDPLNDPSAEEKLKDLDQRLNAIDARERSEKSDMAAEVGANKGYQALGELMGGILGGLGLGWLSDHYLHTLPWGMIVGAILGMAAAVYAIVKTSQK